jgi:hypothetical protein
LFTKTQNIAIRVGVVNLERVRSPTTSVKFGILLFMNDLGMLDKKLNVKNWERK